MKPFEIFRAGTHTSSQGKELTFSDSDIAAMVASYDPKLHHAPIVVGHPKQDAPAYGWVDGLAAAGNRLVAKPADIDPAFADLVKAGRYRKVSAAFYQPDSPNNPTPGDYYLRHVGFLGGAAPAVKGLKAVEFSDDGDLIVEFADTDWQEVWAFEAAARLFRGVRDYLISAAGLEAADKTMSEFDIEQLSRAAATLRADNDTNGLRYADIEKGSKMKPTPGEKTAEELQAELTARETKLAEGEAAFAERERKARADEDKAFVEGIVKDGKLPVGLQAQATALFADLGEDELTFADGEETKKTTPRAAFRDLLGKLPVQAEAKELATGDAIDFSDVDQIKAGIKSEIETAKANGEDISPATAADRLRKRSA